MFLNDGWLRALNFSSFLRSSAQIVWGSATLSFVLFFVEGKEEGVGASLHRCVRPDGAL